DHEQGDEQPSRLAGEMPEERDEPGRRLRVLRSVGRPQESFEQGEHESVASWRLVVMGYRCGWRGARRGFAAVPWERPTPALPRDWAGARIALNRTRRPPRPTACRL